MKLLVGTAKSGAKIRKTISDIRKVGLKILLLLIKAPRVALISLFLYLDWEFSERFGYYV